MRGSFASVPNCRWLRSLPQEIQPRTSCLIRYSTSKITKTFPHLFYIATFYLMLLLLTYFEFQTFGQTLFFHEVLVHFLRYVLVIFWMVGWAAISPCCVSRGMFTNSIVREKCLAKLGLLVADTFIQKRDYPELDGIYEELFRPWSVNFLINCFKYVNSPHACKYKIYYKISWHIWLLKTFL